MEKHFVMKFSKEWAVLRSSKEMKMLNNEE